MADKDNTPERYLYKRPLVIDLIPKKMNDAIAT